ncbi:MAG: hypothetical protein UHH87_02045 [Akkermansia sp.]|nr:hypothetical protein [Akkermansia sp.]MEE1265049.1 hypothetical protein [Akkermansia sp.]
MLFERETVTPHGRLATMEELFARVARRETTTYEPGRVPVEALEAFGNLETPLRYMLEAASSGCKDRTRLAQLRKVEKCLNTLPDALMTSLSAGPEENWMCMFRHLLQLHTLLTDAGIGTDAAEYSTLLQKMVQLAETVSQAAAVEISPASMFTLLLMQVEMQRINAPRKRRKATRKRRKAKTRKTAASQKKEP